MIARAMHHLTVREARYRMPPDGEPSPLCRSRPAGRRSGVTRRAITFFSEPQSLETLNFWAMATATFFTP